MSRYIDRLSPDAAIHFRCTSRPKGARSYTIHEAEDALIELAKRLPAMDPISKLEVTVRSFGEGNVVEAAAVLDQIMADLDSDAEVAGEPVEEKPATNNFTFVFARFEGASPEQVETFAKMIGGILAQRV